MSSADKSAHKKARRSGWGWGGVGTTGPFQFAGITKSSVKELDFKS
jgi:hypothetical protein